VERKADEAPPGQNFLRPAWRVPAERRPNRADSMSGPVRRTRSRTKFLCWYRSGPDRDSRSSAIITEPAIVAAAGAKNRPGVVTGPGGVTELKRCPFEPSLLALQRAKTRDNRAATLYSLEHIGEPHRAPSCAERAQERDDHAERRFDCGRRYMAERRYSCENRPRGDEKGQAEDQSGAPPPSYGRKHHERRRRQQDLTQEQRSPKYPAVSARHLVCHGGGRCRIGRDHLIDHRRRLE